MIDVKQKMDNNSLTIFEIRVPKDNEYTPENAASFLASLVGGSRGSLLTKFLRRSIPAALSLEIVTQEQRTHFQLVVPTPQAFYFESQILAQYPTCILTKIQDPLDRFQTPKTKDQRPKIGSQAAQLILAAPFYFPLKTYRDFKDVDPLASIVGYLTKAEANDWFLFQIVLAPASGNYQKTPQAIINRGVSQPDGRVVSHPHKKLFEEKIAEKGFWVGLRLLAPTKEKLSGLIGTFGVFTRSDGNGLTVKEASFWQRKRFLTAILSRSMVSTPNHQYLNVSEIASLWHLPGPQINLPNIAWGKTIVAEPPENLPVSQDLTDEAKHQINFFARTEFKNQVQTFGIRKSDRRRHIYVIGKTGTGKSTLIANMAIHDFKNREGCCVIDPHGDLTEDILLDYIPSYRINDVCYFDPSDREHPIALNILEVDNPAQKELVASGIVSIFYKLYAHSWGPRMEYILRNTLMTLLEVPQATLVDVPKILTDDVFRDQAIKRLNDEVLLNFWVNEYNKADLRQRTEWISPILNKVGQFVSSPLIRGIIGRPRSTINLADVMNEGKILLMHLSQGKLGEDNAALLGAMIITKLQLAAMSRVHLPEEQRRDFYLYVDEFQNFATTSFIKIVSEARKYRLNLFLANQYSAQVPREIRDAILGNVGTLGAFTIGAEDAHIFTREFGEVFSDNDLVNVGRFQMAIKMAIEGQTCQPFLTQTLPLPRSRNQNREKVLRVSREGYGYKK